jgi:uncharacterized protein YndB with AHSA1/START domain
MDNKHIAEATTTINASVSRVWEALTNPKLIKQYLFGADVISDWKEGSTILYKGIYEGKTYEDKGSVLKVEPEKLLLITQDNNSSEEEQEQNAKFWTMVLDGMKKVLEG